jgi:hypothetical protein
VIKVTKTTLKKLRQFSDQTKHGTELWDGKTGHGLVQVGDLATLMDWLEKNRYDAKIFEEGTRLVQTVARYREMVNGEGEMSFQPGRRK